MTGNSNSPTPGNITEPTAMRHLRLLTLVAAISCSIEAAEPGELLRFNFDDGIIPAAFHDNTYKGVRPELSLVDAADATRGKELSIKVAPGNFAQIILGNLSVAAGPTYSGSITLSALASAEVKFYLRMKDKPYTVLLASTAHVGTSPAVYTLSGVAKEACESAQLMLYTDSQTTLLVDNIILAKPAP